MNVFITFTYCENSWVKPWQSLWIRNIIIINRKEFAIGKQITTLICWEAAVRPARCMQHLIDLTRRKTIHLVLTIMGTPKWIVCTYNKYKVYYRYTSCAVNENNGTQLSGRKKTLSRQKVAWHSYSQLFKDAKWDDADRWSRKKCHWHVLAAPVN